MIGYPAMGQGEFGGRHKSSTVVFYTELPFLFRSTTIGHLYEISQKYDVVLLAEELDSETEKIIKDKNLFPKLKEVIPVRQFTGAKRNPLAKNRYFFNLAKKVILNYKPDIVIVGNDFYSLELYLLRFARKMGAINVCLQSCLRAEKLNDLVLKSYLMNAYVRLPSFLPLSIRIFLVKVGKYLKHFFYYWILPIMVGERPFFGRASCFLWPNIGARDTDYLVALSDRDFNYYLKDGIPPEKLFILSHPLQRESTKQFFDKAYFSKENKIKKAWDNQKILTAVFSSRYEIAFRRSDYSRISEEEIAESRRKTIIQIAKFLKGWKILIKPHPQRGGVPVMGKIPKSISDFIEILNPLEPVDKYIEISDVIVGFPPSSTVLFTASLQCPEKIILSLDLMQEFLGDYYRNFKGIKYIDREEEFIEILKAINDNKYQRELNKYNNEEIKELESKEFSNTVELLEHLFQKRGKKSK